MAGASGSRRHFAELASAYDRLRPVDEAWWEVFETLVAVGDLRGRRVLDVGCGTGRLAAALAAAGATVWGVDPSEEMLAEAHANASKAHFRRASAEALPFKDGWFERAVLRLVVQHLDDRPRAFAEVGRVLGAGGRVVVATFAPESFAGHWAARFFPEVEPIDAARFPGADALERDLGAAGFERVRARLLRQHSRLSRADALERLRGRYISTLALLDDDAYARGLARAERELDAEVEDSRHWLLVAAERP